MDLKNRMIFPAGEAVDVKLQNLPEGNIFAKLLDVPGALLYSMVLSFCTVGVYSMRFSIFDVFLMIFWFTIPMELQLGIFLRDISIMAKFILC